MKTTYISFFRKDCWVSWTSSGEGGLLEVGGHLQRQESRKIGIIGLRGGTFNGNKSRQSVSAAKNVVSSELDTE